MAKTTHEANLMLETAVEQALAELGADSRLVKFKNPDGSPGFYGAKNNNVNAIRTAKLADQIILMGLRTAHNVDLGNDLTFLAKQRLANKDMQDGQLRRFTGASFVGSLDTNKPWDIHQWALPLYTQPKPKE